MSARKVMLTNDRAFHYATGSDLAVGGSEKHQWSLSRALTQAGWSVTIGTRCLNPGVERWISGVRFLGLPSSTRIASLGAFARQERADWWYWCNASHLLGPIVALAKMSGTRTIFSARFDTDVSPKTALTLRQRWWPLYSWGLAHADRIFVQHRGQLERLRAEWRAKANIIPGLVSLPNKADLHALRSSYVAWVGMLRWPKRPDLLVEIASRTPETRYVVCGGPSPHRSPADYSQTVVKSLGGCSNIDYLGRVDHSTTTEIIGHAGLLLSTSEAEGFPNVFLEAWASGTPVVSLSIDPDDLIRRFELGRVSGDVTGAVRDVRELMPSVELRQRMGDRGRDYVKTNHCDAAVVRAFEKALESPVYAAA